MGSLECRKPYRGAGKSLALPGRKQARKYVRDGRDFNKIETQAAKFPPPPPPPHRGRENNTHFL